MKTAGVDKDCRVVSERLFMELLEGVVGLEAAALTVPILALLTVPVGIYCFWRLARRENDRFNIK